jgi:hypothetical protein
MIAWSRLDGTNWTDRQLSKLTSHEAGAVRVIASFFLLDVVGRISAIRSIFSAAIVSEPVAAGGAGDPLCVDCSCHTGDSD